MDRMAKILGLKSRVHLISNKSLLLKAETQSGRIIEDEGDIVEWDNPNDKIVRAILMGEDGEYIPSVGEGTAHTKRSIFQIIEEADIIIFSSGTQWSSLIPTYIHRGFREMIQKSSAKKYLVMNNVEDHDVVGVSAAELCGILERYLDMDELTVVVNEYAADSMSSVPSKYSSIRDKLSMHGTKTHIPEALVKAIMRDYYKEALACKRQFFDLDGTLWNESGTLDEKQAGAINLELFDGAIVSGNAVEHVRSVLERHAPAGKAVEVFADYGNTHFSTKAPDHLTALTDKYFLPEKLLEKIAGMVPFQHKSVKTRGGVVITVKPLEDRERIVAELSASLIDIMYSDYTKAAMMKLIFKQYGIAPEEAVFIGNELKQGSEKGIMKLGITTLQVNDVYECYVYLKTRALCNIF